MTDPSKLDIRVWGGGLLWGGAMLLLGLFFAAWFVGDVHDAQVGSPTLSPATASTMELDPAHAEGRLVDVEGFEFACEETTLDSERLLVPGRGPNGAQIFIAFEHGSSCREAPTPLRGRATLMSTKLSSELGLADPGPDQDGLGVVIVEPHEVNYWLILAVLLFGGLGALGAYSAWFARNELINEVAEAGAGPVPIKDDQRDPPHPYRPGLPGRLITEDLEPAAARLTKLHRWRRVRVGLGVILIVTSLTVAFMGGRSIYQREQIWTHGIVAPNASASGETRRSLGVLVETRLDVTYLDAAGGVHREELSAMSLLVGMDDSAELEVRYLSEAPERLAISWIHELRWACVALVASASILLLGLGWLLVTSAHRDRTPERIAAVFDDPRELLLDLSSVERQLYDQSDGGGETGARTYHFEVRDSERRWTHFANMKGPYPLFIDEAEAVGIALYNPRDPDYLLVLSEELDELHQPPFSPAELRGRYRDRDVPSSG